MGSYYFFFLTSEATTAPNSTGGEGGKLAECHNHHSMPVALVWNTLLYAAAGDENVGQ